MFKPPLQHFFLRFQSFYETRKSPKTTPKTARTSENQNACSFSGPPQRGFPGKPGISGFPEIPSRNSEIRKPFSRIRPRFRQLPTPSRHSPTPFQRPLFLLRKQKPRNGRTFFSHTKSLSQPTTTILHPRKHPFFPKQNIRIYAPTKQKQYDIIYSVFNGEVYGIFRTFASTYAPSYRAT